MNKIFYALAEWIPIKPLRRRIKGLKIANCEHKEVAEYLNAHYVIPYFKGELKRWEFKQKQDLRTQDIIWQLWFQGEEQAPKIVKACLDSVKKQMGNTHTIIVLDAKSIEDYIDFPPFVLEKLEKGIFSKTFFSDLLRVALLATYGGVWLDATMFLSDRIPQEILEKEFFAFCRSQTPPSDYKQWINFDYRYFSWNPNFKVKFSSSLMLAKQEQSLCRALVCCMLAYWQREKELKHYFIFQIFFELLVQNQQFLHCRDTAFGDTAMHLLQFYAKNPYNAALWDSIKEKSAVHKLTYFKNLPQNSMVDKVLQGK